MSTQTADICEHCGVDLWVRGHKRDCKRPLTPSPRPWRIGKDVEKTIPIMGRLKGRHGITRIVEVENDDCDTDQSKANAQLIVRAVNSHDELLATSKALLEWCNERFDNHGNDWVDDAPGGLCDALEAAIDEAEGR